MNVSSTMMHTTVDGVEKSFSTLSKPAPTVVTSFSARTEADKLVAQIDEWLANNPGSSSTSQVQDIRSQVAGANSRQLKVLQERFGLASSA